MNALILYIGLLAASPAADRDHLAIALFGGGAVNFPTRLTIARTDWPDIELSARYDTKPFEQPVYYAARIEFRRQRRGLELQLIHHKLFLANPPPDVQSFEVTHGYNIVTVNGCLRGERVDFRLGAGFVVAHVEAVVRGYAADGWVRFRNAFALTGPAFMVGAGKNFPLPGNFFIAADLELVAARASVAFEGVEWGRAPGTASVPNIAVHLLVGIGYRPLYSPPGEK